MNLVVICGSGAVGKMTVGQELMKITDYRLFHNHMMIEPVIEIFGNYNGKVVSKLREDIFDAFIESDNEGLIFTYMWAYDMQSDWDYINGVKEKFEASGGTVYFVELMADRNVRVERNKTENRLANKASKRDTAISEERMIREETKYRLVSNEGEIPFAHYIKIDNTFLEPYETAEIIKKHFNLPDKGATDLLHKISLEEVTAKDLETVHKMQVESFMPLYDKYHDEGSPAIEPIEMIERRFNQEGRKYYFIKIAGARVGVINITEKKDDAGITNRISPIFVLPRFQKHGYGYGAVLQAFLLYPHANRWVLETILQVSGNCHLYERCGFVRTGEEHKVNESMTLIDYVKNCN